MEYGLIGARLGHSYSKIIHEMLCGYHYDLCPLPTEEEGCLCWTWCALPARAPQLRMPRLSCVLLPKRSL